MTRLLKVPIYRQSPSYCGPSSLRMILAYYGVHASEKALARASGAQKGIGTSAKGIVKAAKRYGFSANIKDHARISDIRECLSRGVPPIVNWFSTDEGHYSVVTGMDRQRIYLNDPEKARKRDLLISRFEGCWFDFDSRKKMGKQSLIVRRLIIIEKASQLPE